MKKIGILTLVFDNYGTRLQSYALCHVLKTIMDCDTIVEVIDIEPTWTNRNISPFKLLRDTIRGYGFRSLYHLFELAYWMYGVRKERKQDHRQEIFRRKDLFKPIISKIPYTTKKYSCEDVRRGNLPDYDVYLVGSDQVWNGIKVGNQDVYMLDFLNKKKGLTYAASFGMTTILQSMLKDYKRRINNFKTLLIREKEGVDLCKMLGRDDAKLVLDPTLLLDKSGYSDLLESNNHISIDGDYILVYSLNQSLKIYDEAYKLAQKNDCKMIVLKRSFCPPKIDKYKNAEELFAVSPESFLWLIDHSRCVVTNSYHGVLFSINFRKNFYVYLNNADEENSRISTVTDMFGLQDRVYWETEHLPLNINNINYSNVDVVLSEKKRQSLHLLEKSIKESLE